MQPLRYLITAHLLLAGGAWSALAPPAPAPRQEVALRYRFRPFHGAPGWTDGQTLVAREPLPEGIREPRYQSAKPLYRWATLGQAPARGHSDTTIAFVLDESTGSGSGYDLLYVDANNNEDLTDDRPVRAQHRQGQRIFGPLALLLDLGERRQLYHAQVSAYEGQRAPEYRLASLGYFAGEARFGAKSCPVALVDANANGLYGDPFREADADRMWRSDLFLVDLNRDGKFERTDQIPVEALFCGRCVVVDGRFYELETQADGSRLGIRPALVALEPLRSDYSRFTLLLANAEGAFPIHARNGKALVPAGQYRLLIWSIEQRAGNANWQVQGLAPPGAAPQVVVAGKGGTSFQLRSPLLAKVEPRGSGRDLIFQMNVTTGSGEQVTNIAVNGGRPPEPTMRILDERGAEVASLRFHYG